MPDNYLPKTDTLTWCFYLIVIKRQPIVAACFFMQDFPSMFFLSWLAAHNVHVCAIGHDPPVGRRKATKKKQKRDLYDC